MNAKLAPIAELIASGTFPRVLAFGSSNTERRLPGMHWFDCLDLALHQRFGAIASFHNTGIGGHTTRDLLQRFDRDAAFYKPHVAFVTIGGNDANPAKEMSEEEFETNLTQIWQKFNALGTRVIFQTYYAVNSDGSEHFLRFGRFSNIVRHVAQATDSALIDHLKRWEPLRLQKPELYRPLMQDAFHVNERGNKVLGIDIVRAFGWHLNHDLEYWGEALYIQRLMDDLSPDTSA